jgi:hypothetical protein
VSYDSFTAYAKATGNDSHSRAADPRFVDAAGDDFQLQSSSPAIDTGAYLRPRAASTRQERHGPREA